MISIKNLSISYKKNENVIEDLNLQMQENCIHGIVGLNGAGKTTLLNSIFGLKKYNKGEILFNNKKLSKKIIIYLPTENYFYSNITGREYLNLFKNKEFDTEKWNSLFLLPLDKIIDTYSNGMKKKLALLGILKKDKPIMILDEPFNGLDIETSRIIRSILLKLKEKGNTIIVTSHIIETLTNMCDYIHYLENGRIKYNKVKYEFEDFENEIFNSIENKNKELIKELIK
ncbi:MAG: ATP-binding cassette domain-containing protein [Bacteroidales bacterium]|nr:ATP-binding cassette domain-containing protein [Bacteroidales bacterium]